MQTLIDKFISEEAIPKLKAEGCPTNLQIFYDEDFKTFTYLYSGEADLEIILPKLDADLDLLALLGVSIPETSELKYFQFDKLKEYDEDDQDLYDTWVSRIASHIRYTFDNIIEELKTKILLTRKIEFSIPEKIKHNFKNTEGGFSSIDKWQAKIILRNSMNDDDPLKLGDFQDARYSMLHLDTGLIVPIAMADEHHQGYDLIHKYVREGLIPQGRYFPIDIVTYAPSPDRAEELQMTLAAFRLWRKMGGPNYMVEGGARQNFKMTMDDYIKLEGKVPHHEDIGDNLYPLGKRVINNLEKIIEDFRKTRINPRFPTKKIFNNTIELFQELQKATLFTKCREPLSLLEKDLLDAEAREDLSSLEQVLFAHKGIKNIIHIALKDAVAAESKYAKENMIQIFGNINLALAEFDRLSCL